MFRKNVAGQVIHFQGVDSATGGIKSGVTWTVRRCIDGTFAAGGGTVTEDGSTGWYKYAMSQADTNGNNIGFNFTGAGAIPQTVNIITTAADPTDAVRLGLTALPNAAAEAAGGLYTRGTGAGQINQPANGMVDANVVRNAGTAITAASGVQEVKVQSVATDAINAGAIAADAIGSSELAATAASEIASAVRTELTTELGRVDVAVSTRSSHSVADIWNALTSGMSTAGSIGKRLIDFLTGDIFARLGAPAGASVSADIAALQSDTDNIQTRIPAALTANGNMKSSLMEILSTALTETAGQIADSFKKFFNVASSTGTVNSLPDAAPGAAGGLLVDDVWTDARAAKLDNLDAAVSTRSNHSVLDIWNVLTSNFSLAGSIGKRIVDFLTGDAYARLGAPVGASISADIAGVKTSTSSIESSLSTVDGKIDTIDDFLDTEIAAIKAKTDNLPGSPAATGDIPTSAAIADAVWDESASAHQTGGSFGAAVGSPLVRGYIDPFSGVFITFSGGEVAQSAQGNTVITPLSPFTVEYDGQFQGWLFVVSDSNSWIKFTASVLTSDASDGTLTLSQPVPTIGGLIDPIPFILIPAGVGDASRALILYEGN